MKRFIVLIMALLFTVTIGCDGDGDSSEIPPPAPGYVSGTGTGGGILERGSGTVPAGPIQVSLTSLSVSETGRLEGRLTWSGGPTELSPAFIHIATAELEYSKGVSPQYVNMQVTQALLDQGHDWVFNVINIEANPAEVEYRIIFRPN